jgi:hypothetical protein
MKIHIVTSWVRTPCRLVGGCQRLGGTYYLHLQVISEDYYYMFFEMLV